MQHDVCVVWNIARVPHINAVLKPRRCSTQFWSMQLLSHATPYYMLCIATSLTCGGFEWRRVKFMLKLKVVKWFWKASPLAHCIQYVLDEEE
jgi:hypothetical protein